MDDELFQRFQDGDPEALTALRNQLRSVAARVLMAPQWSLNDVQLVRRLEQQAALAALDCGANNRVDFARAAMLNATVRSIEHVRHRDALPVSRLSAELLAKVAMETASRPQQEEANKLLEDSAADRRLLETARSALRTAAMAQVALPPRQPAKTAPRPKRKPIRPVTAARRATKKRRLSPKKSESGGLRAIAPFVVIAVVFGTLGYSRLAPEPEPVEVTIAWLLPQETPPTGRANELSGLAKEAVLNLRKGRCDQSADRLHMEFRKNSDNLWVRYYEGLAWVCSRNGLKAMEALRDVQKEMEEPPFGLEWWLAQAQLLAGDLAAGLGTLDALSGTEHPRAVQAAALARAIREQLG
jgi:hypothetical protein